MSDTFKVRWQASDGYVGGSRPQSFTVSDDDLDDDMTDKELRELFDDLLEK